jgi:hypothetical protein
MKRKNNKSRVKVPQFAYKKSPREFPIKAWALVEDDELCHHYALAYITFTREQAMIERDTHNSEPLNHKMKIVRVKIDKI